MRRAPVAILFWGCVLSAVAVVVAVVL